MKIIHFLVGRPKPESSNGVVKSVYYLSKHELQYSDVEVWCISSRKNPGEYTLDTGIKCKIFPSHILNFKKNIDSELKKTKNNVIFHLHGIFSIYNLILALKLNRYKIKYLISPHGSLRAKALAQSKYKKKIVIPIVKFYTQRAIKIRALSLAEAIDICKFGIKKSKVTIIPNGVESIYFENSPILMQKKIFESKILTFIGRLDVFNKGLDILIKAMAEVPLISLYLIGPFFTKNDEKIIKCLINNLNLKEKIFIMGEMYGSEKIEFLKRSFFFIYTSRFEGLPLSVLEALSFGIPVIVSDFLDPKRVIQHHNAGFVTTTDVHSLRDTLRQILTLNFKEWLKMRDAAWRLAEKNFLWNKIAEKMNKEYEKIGQDLI